MIFGKGVNDLAGVSDQKVYTVWHSMIRRAYSSVYHAGKPSYVGVEVVGAWHKLSGFVGWFDKNYVEGWQLDKDVLGNGRLYSPETCCFVPQEINSVLINQSTGVYFKQANNKYCAQYSDSTCTRKTVYLGLFEREEDAAKAYVEHKSRHVAQLASKYKSQLSEKAYAALCSWNTKGGKECCNLS